MQRATRPSRSQTNLHLLRNRALLLVAVQSCLRSVDLLNLNWFDMLADDGQVHVHWDVIQQKTGASVKIELPPETREAIREYAQSAAHHFGHLLTLTSPLFPPLSSKHPWPEHRLSYSSYVKMVKAWVAEIGLDERRYGTHSLRATLPSAYYEHTRDPMGAMKLFGHRSLTATADYLKKFIKVAPIRDLFSGSEPPPQAPPERTTWSEASPPSPLEEDDPTGEIIIGKGEPGPLTVERTIQVDAETEVSWNEWQTNAALRKAAEKAERRRVAELHQAIADEQLRDETDNLDLELIASQKSTAHQEALAFERIDHDPPPDPVAAPEPIAELIPFPEPREQG